MAETSNLGLPLVAPAQAQKHVTVNESFLRLDALTHLVLQTVGNFAPPVTSVEGDAHAVGSGATGLWAGQGGTVAIYQNGGWAFVTPVAGWKGWSAASGTSVTFDGAEWIEGAGALFANGAGFVHRTIEVDHAISSGAVSIISALIPANTSVYGVTGRVLSDIGGASSFEIGVSGSANRYGGGIGTGTGAWARGLTSSPLAYYSDTDLVLSATGGNFDGTGTLRLAVHLAELKLPRA
jgi:hypothetical protein